MANQELRQRLRGEFESLDSRLFVTIEDLGLILNTLLDHKQLQDSTKEEVMNFLERKTNEMNYEQLSDMAVIFASKVDEKYQDLFFKNFLNKFASNLEFIGEEALYKILWSFVKAGRLEIK